MLSSEFRAISTRDNAIAAYDRATHGTTVHYLELLLDFFNSTYDLQNLTNSRIEIPIYALDTNDKLLALFKELSHCLGSNDSKIIFPKDFHIAITLAAGIQEDEDCPNYDNWLEEKREEHNANVRAALCNFLRSGVANSNIGFHIKFIGYHAESNFLDESVIAALAFIIQSEHSPDKLLFEFADCSDDLKSERETASLPYAKLLVALRTRALNSRDSDGVSIIFDGSYSLDVRLFIATLADILRKNKKSSSVGLLPKNVSISISELNFCDDGDPNDDVISDEDEDEEELEDKEEVDYPFTKCIFDDLLPSIKDNDSLQNFQFKLGATSFSRDFRERNKQLMMKNMGSYPQGFVLNIEDGGDLDDSRYDSDNSIPAVDIIMSQFNQINRTNDEKQQELAKQTREALYQLANNGESLFSDEHFPNDILELIAGYATGEYRPAVTQASSDNEDEVLRSASPSEEKPSAKPSFAATQTPSAQGNPHSFHNRNPLPPGVVNSDSNSESNKKQKFM